jgi:flagellar M-ring protein FliF
VNWCFFNSLLGIPEEPAPGLELFNDAEYGMSEFTQRVNYRRAIEAEIARTIRSFAEVSSARVHLTIPKKSIFKDEKVAPKASVTVKPRPGQQLSHGQITGITQLVAASVEDLRAENVIVLNEKGEIVSVQDKDSVSNLQNTKYDLEHRYAEKAFDLVQGIARTDDIKISVNITYNTDRVKAVREQLLPNSDGKVGHLRRLKKQTTETGGEKSDKPSSNSTIDEEYVFSTERSEIEYTGGEIEHLGIGIVVAADLPEAAISNITRVVSSGLGIDFERGDSLAVVTIPPTANSVDNKGVVASHPVELTDAVAPAAPSPTYARLEDRDSMLLIAGLALALVSIISLGLYMVYLRSRRVKPLLLSSEEQELLLLELKTWLSRDTVGANNA